MPDRLDINKGETILQHTLRTAWLGIFQAISDEDGLDAGEGERILSLIVDSLGYDPAGRLRCSVSPLNPRECRAF